MNKKQIFEQLRVYDKIIQACEVDYSNFLPYYKATTELQNIYNLLDFNGCCESFDNFVKEQCLDFIRDSIKMSKEAIPDQISKIENERIWFMEYTLKQLKHTSSQCILYLKYAYEDYCPNET